MSRASVRQAHIVLKVQGLVEVRHGEGAILLKTRPNSAVLSAVQAHTRRAPGSRHDGAPRRISSGSRRGWR
ncbi:MAG: hypothetical protein ACR2FV_05935 [Ornithinimicrobium sp.]|uniref:hypothetical protein n=1 Tax=Ornithinimicrobium sp. TaxID=1977084 RepID=UPI003D9BD54E